MAGADASTRTEGEVELGYVIGTHGVRGDLRVRLHDSRNDSLASGCALRFRERGGGPITAELRLASLDSGTKKGELRMKLEGITSREQAETLRAHGLWMLRDALPEPDDDEYYLVDTIGCPVFAPDDLLALGVVVAVTTNGAQDLLEVEFKDDAGAKHRWLLPAIEGFVLEFKDRRVRADPPPGLMPQALEDALHGSNSDSEPGESPDA